MRALAKTRGAVDGWRVARRDAAAARRDRRAGEYPVIDRPLTVMERWWRRRARIMDR